MNTNSHRPVERRVPCHLLTGAQPAAGAAGRGDRRGHDWSTADGVAELRRPPTPLPRAERRDRHDAANPAERPAVPQPRSRDAPQTAGRDR